MDQALPALRQYKRRHADPLAKCKVKDSEPEQLTGRDLPFFELEFAPLLTVLETERDRSSVLDTPVPRSDYNDLLVRVRRKR